MTGIWYAGASGELSRTSAHRGPPARPDRPGLLGGGVAEAFDPLPGQRVVLQQTYFASLASAWGSPVVCRPAAFALLLAEPSSSLTTVPSANASPVRTAC